MKLEEAENGNTSLRLLFYMNQSFFPALGAEQGEVYQLRVCKYFDAGVVAKEKLSVSALQVNIIIVMGIIRAYDTYTV